MNAPDTSSFSANFFGLLTRKLQKMGALVLDAVGKTGHAFIFLIAAMISIFKPPYRPANLLQRIHFIGIRSLFIIILTAAFTGMVLALQGFYMLSKFGSEGLLGPAVALSIVKELGPVLSALMVTGRAGSALTSELGIQRIREQLDALETMGIQPMKYIVAPCLQAGMIVFPLLNIIFNCIGIFGGYVVAVQLLNLSSGTYFGGIQSALVMQDITIGLIKSFTFGIIVIWICTYQGYYAQRGAKGVSQATTSAVVQSSVLILMMDYVITSLTM
ncbi:MlaE family ABC transporter permease [Magnetococcales bacterium HHB-1]